jgi:CRP-like cAMP-binding protein
MAQHVAVNEKREASRLSRPRRSISKYRKGETVFSQGKPADAVFYILKGKVKVTVVSEQGKEAVVAILGPDEFCGEGCLTGQPLRLATAVAMTEC